MESRQLPQKTTLEQIPHWYWKNMAHSGEAYCHLPSQTTLTWDGFLSVPLVLTMICLSPQLPCSVSKCVDCLILLSGESKHWLQEKNVSSLSPWSPWRSVMCRLQNKPKAILAEPEAHITLEPGASCQRRNLKHLRTSKQHIVIH